MDFNYRDKKVYHAMIYFVSNTQNCHMLKLLKQLHLLDSLHFKETGVTVTGRDYYKWPQGPVNKSIREEITKVANSVKPLSVIGQYIKVTKEPGNNHDVFCFTPLIDFNPSYFSKRELRLLEQISKETMSKTGDQLSKESHNNDSPWEQTPDNAKIDFYLYVDDEEQRELFKEMNYEKEQIEEFFNAP